MSSNRRDVDGVNTFEDARPLNNEQALVLGACGPGSEHNMQYHDGRLSRFQRLALWCGPLLALLVLALMSTSSLGMPAAVTAAITVWCVVWWVFEPVPIPVTSLLPLALLPLLEVLSPAQVGQAYGSPLVLLLLGGFILSRALETTGAHRRVALAMVNALGSDSPRRLVFGFMVASAVLSMWISNTATTLMLLPVAMAILQNSSAPDLKRPLLLGIAYAASIGGIGTPIGTPPNLVFMQVYQENTGLQVGFIEWMSWAVPLVVILVPITALWLTRHTHSVLDIKLPAVGRWRLEEKRVMIVFAFTALAWITRKEPFGGWSGFLDLPKANDASVALLAVILLFVIPNGKGGRLLNWEAAVTIPWGMLLLFGGGICLAKAFVVSGLSQVLGASLGGLTALPLLLTLLCLTLAVSFLTETTSNTASTTLLMPILAAAALAVNIDPLLLMVPAAMSASCAFMLPVATAPNTIVFGSQCFTTKEMAHEGFVLNVIAAVLISLLCWMVLT